MIIMLGNFEKEKKLRDAILKFSNLWKPATQNGYDVCAYAHLKVEFVDEKINIEILQ